MSRRAERVASLLQDLLSEIIMFELNDPIFKKFISITEIKIGDDLRKATVYFRVYDADPAELETALSKAKGYIKKLLAERMTIKFLPDIEFKQDLREEEEKRLDELFARIKKS
jgi:ribosome-binding factor A